MKFYFDESGRFNPSPHVDKQRKTSCVVGMVISEAIEERFIKGFEEFVAELSPEELDDGEPKGNLLTVNSRWRFCRLLKNFRYDGVLLAPVLADMSTVSSESGAFSAAGFAEHLRRITVGAEEGKDKEDVLHLAGEFDRLSNPQAWRLMLWGIAVMRSLDEAMFHLQYGIHKNCWENIVFEIDRVETTNIGIEAKVFVRMVPAWLRAYSRLHPFRLGDHVPEDQPFLTRYGMGDGIDLNKILDNNIRFVDSKKSLGIQVADIASNILQRAAHFPNNKYYEQDLYREVMLACQYPHEKGPLTYVSSTLDMLPDVSNKYEHLCQWW